MSYCWDNILPFLQALKLSTRYEMHRSRNNKGDLLFWIMSIHFSKCICNQILLIWISKASRQLNKKDVLIWFHQPFWNFLLWFFDGFYISFTIKLLSVCCLCGLDLNYYSKYQIIIQFWESITARSIKRIHSEI